jgi:hypothetical protein
LKWGKAFTRLFNLFMYLINFGLNYQILNLFFFKPKKLRSSLKQNIDNIQIFDHLMRQDIINIYFDIILVTLKLKISLQFF